MACRRGPATPMLALLLALAAPACGAAVADDFGYVRSASQAQGPGPDPGVVVVDARPLAECRERSLAGARCLPAGDLLGPQRRLPAARDLLWLLGTAGLAGHETVLVVGQDPTARDFVAGVLYAAGQRRVQILTEPVGRALASGAAAGPGRERGLVREAVFEAPMRDRLLVLRDELRAMRPAPMLLDGRSDREYWGEVPRAVRTGHLPGAISLPALQLRAALDAADGRGAVVPDGSPVAYAHDAFEGFAYLSLLVAANGVAARLYAEGWAEWAADGSLPADAVGYPDPGPVRAGGPPAASVTPSVDAPGPVAWPPREALVAAATTLALAAFAAGWWLSGRRAAS